MQQLSQYGQSVQADLAGRYGLSFDAVRAMMDAVSAGGGAQAQFSIPELGGMGQWQQGGMIMVGDMFNHGLQARVANFCGEISNAYYNGSFYVLRPVSGAGGFSAGGGQWWPSDLGQPSSSGMQNNQGYAIFPQMARLATLRDGVVRVYDTGQHMIGGVGQQQGWDGSVSFTSQFGPVLLTSLPLLSGPEVQAPTPQPPLPEQVVPEPVTPEPAPVQQAPVQQEPELQAPTPQPQPQAGAAGDIYDALGKLGSLRDAGILTEDEFQAKKTQLLDRL